MAARAPARSRCRESLQERGVNRRTADRYRAGAPGGSNWSSRRRMPRYRSSPPWHCRLHRQRSTSSGTAAPWRNRLSGRGWRHAISHADRRATSLPTQRPRRPPWRWTIRGAFSPHVGALPIAERFPPGGISEQFADLGSVINSVAEHIQRRELFGAGLRTAAGMITARSSAKIPARRAGVQGAQSAARADCSMMTTSVVTSSPHEPGWRTASAAS